MARRACTAFRCVAPWRPRARKPAPCARAGSRRRDAGAPSQAPGGRQRPGSGAQAGKRKAGGGEEPANEGEEEGDDDGGDGGGEEGGGGAGSAGGPADEKEERRLRRLLRNRVSAQQARERKKTYLKEIENHTSMLEASVAALEQRVQSLERENAMLRQLLKSSSATAGGAGSSALQPGWLEVQMMPPGLGLLQARAGFRPGAARDGGSGGGWPQNGEEMIRSVPCAGGGPSARRWSLTLALDEAVG